MQGLSPHMESRVPHHIPGVSSSLVSQPLLDSQVPYGRLQHPLTIYPLDQMRSSHAENDYIDSPAVISQQPPGGGGQKGVVGDNTTTAAPGSRGRVQGAPINTWQQDSSPVAFLGANHNHHHNHHHHQQQQQQGGRCEATTHPWISFSGRPGSVSSSSSTSSEQRLLDHAAPTPTLDPHHHHHHHHHQPHHHQGSQQPARTLGGCLAVAPPQSSAAGDPKVLTTASSSSSSICSSSSKSLDLKASSNATAGGGGVVAGGVCGGGQPPIPSSPAEKKKQHLALCCERCGKCRCTECTLPRALPQCWVCNQECLCSARSLVDAATCMCLVRGVFYHCASEDEDGDEGGSCADRPCSCAPSQAHCCARWSFMAALSAVLPCLLCYLPATGLAKLGQRCYDSVSRPGCRCKQQGTAAAGVAGCKSGGGGGGGGGVEGKAQGGTEKQQQQGS